MQQVHRGTRLAELLVHASCALLAVLLLLALGRPLFTDDLWWHLALGEAYLAQGPWLDADPLLHTATGPREPAAWLFEVASFALARALGSGGLRLGHVATAAAILALAWQAFRRASGSRVGASLGAGAFLVLASYRLFQLRPELATILATLVLYGLLIEGTATPSRARVGVAAALCAVWANLHAGFLLGPLLIAVAATGVALSIPLRPPARRPQVRSRASRLGEAAVLSLLATLLNPSGLTAPLAYFRAGGATPALTNVVDEWARFDPLRLPAADLPPSPLAWTLVWALLLLTPPLTLSCVRRWREAGDERECDGALVAMAGASLVATLLAVRFLWLEIFPLLLVARAAAGRRTFRPRVAAWAAAAAALALVPGFLRFGDWPILSRGVPTHASTYLEPYAAQKYYAHSVWFLRDVGVTGNLYNAYFEGGFLGYWLAPELRVFIDGSLNVPVEVMRAYASIQLCGGEDPGGDLLALLDHHGVDLFVGVGLPIGQHPNRPWRYTTAHLERAPGWIVVFRTLRSAVYLRRNERNRDNLRRVGEYYARAQVPFDSERGFEVEQVVRDAPAWAVRHGLVPRDFSLLVRRSFALDFKARSPAVERLAALYAALGLYERAAELDRRTLAADPGRITARRRLVWSLLRLDRAPEALDEARALDEIAGAGSPSLYVARAAQEYATLEDARQRDTLVALLPVFTRAEAAALASAHAAPESRPFGAP
jgi:hypothetical protein